MDLSNFILQIALDYDQSLSCSIKCNKVWQTYVQKLYKTYLINYTYFACQFLVWMIKISFKFLAKESVIISKLFVFSDSNILSNISVFSKWLRSLSPIAELYESFRWVIVLAPILLKKSV